jgi:hypothetical protein
MFCFIILVITLLQKANGLFLPFSEFNFLAKECKNSFFNDSTNIDVIGNIYSTFPGGCCPSSVGILEGSNLTSTKTVGKLAGSISDSFVLNFWIKPRIPLSKKLIVLSIPSSDASSYSFQVSQFPNPSDPSKGKSFFSHDTDFSNLLIFYSNI